MATAKRAKKKAKPARAGDRHRSKGRLVRLPPELDERLKDKAADLDRPINECVVEAVEAWVAKEGSDG